MIYNDTEKFFVESKGINSTLVNSQFLFALVCKELEIGIKVFKILSGV
jgi:hypothetical protein